MDRIRGTSIHSLILRSNVCVGDHGSFVYFRHCPLHSRIIVPFLRISYVTWASHREAVCLGLSLCAPGLSSRRLDRSLLYWPLTTTPLTSFLRLMRWLASHRDASNLILAPSARVGLSPRRL